MDVIHEFNGKQECVSIGLQDREGVKVYMMRDQCTLILYDCDELEERVIVQPGDLIKDFKVL